MKLLLTINGADEQIEIVTPAPACRFRFGNEAESQADVEYPEPGVYSILLNGRSHDAYVEDTSDFTIVVIDGYRFEIDVNDPRRWQPKRSGAAGEGVVTVVAPMPGKIVRVLVSPGDSIEAGQGIVVVEAMKMQNEMKSPKTGRLLTLSAREGAAVSAGEVLATIG
jgi:biotin carboxyl carrier protein